MSTQNFSGTSVYRVHPHSEGENEWKKQNKQKQTNDLPAPSPFVFNLFNLLENYPK